MDDPAHIGEADARSFKFVGPVQPLEDAEQFVEILHVEPDSIIADK